MYAAAIAASIETFAAEVGFEPLLKNKNAVFGCKHIYFPWLSEWVSHHKVYFMYFLLVSSFKNVVAMLRRQSNDVKRNRPFG